MVHLQVAASRSRLPSGTLPQKSRSANGTYKVLPANTPFPRHARKRTVFDNYRMQHFQAAMLLQQIEKLVQETQVRQANADYLMEQLRQIPGIAPARLPERSRAVWHMFPLRYDARQFHGLPREKFVQALGAEGISCGGGYSEQYFDGMIDEAIHSRGYRRLWPAERLTAYRDSLRNLPGNRRVCATTVVLPQNLLLAARGNMDHNDNAIRKIQAHAEALAKA